MPSRQKRRSTGNLKRGNSKQETFVMLRDNRNVHIFPYRGWFHFVCERPKPSKPTGCLHCNESGHVVASNLGENPLLPVRESTAFIAQPLLASLDSRAKKGARGHNRSRPSPKIDSPLKRRQPRPLDPADNPRFPSRAYSSFLFPRSPPSSRGGVATIGRTDVARTSKQTGNVRVPYDCAACTSLPARSSPARRSSFTLPSVHRSIAIVDRVHP